MARARRRSDTHGSFEGPFLVYRAGSPESLGRLLRRLASTVGAGVVLSGCPSLPQDACPSPEVEVHAQQPLPHARRPSDNCWYDSGLKAFPSRVVTTDPGVRGSYKDRELPRHAMCAIACPVPPVELGEPVALGNDEAERTVIEYERMPCDVSYGGVVCRYRKHTMYQRNNACSFSGRRPRGLGALEQVRGTAAGAWLARMAALEAASVPAFEELTESLVFFDAPAALVRDSRRAADDERRHARLVGDLARRYGVEPVDAPVAESKPVSRQRLGHDNLIEGCVRETLGAALGYWQAEHARDPVVRKVMRSIAADEARHADLSWRIHAWLGHPRHDGDVAAEIAALRASVVDDEVADELGHPDADETRALVTAMAEALWVPLTQHAAAERNGSRY